MVRTKGDYTDDHMMLPISNASSAALGRASQDEDEEDDLEVFAFDGNDDAAVNNSHSGDRDGVDEDTHGLLTGHRKREKFEEEGQVPLIDAKNKDWLKMPSPRFIVAALVALALFCSLCLLVRPSKRAKTWYSGAPLEPGLYNPDMIAHVGVNPLPTTVHYHDIPFASVGNLYDKDGKLSWSHQGSRRNGA